MPRDYHADNSTLARAKFGFALLTLLGLALFLFSPAFVRAQTDIDPGQEGFGLQSDFANVGVRSERDLKDTIAQIINIALGFLGIIAVILMIYAGFLWMTAHGNEDQVKKAKLILRNAVIGLVIIFASWAIATFVINRLRQAALGQNGDGGGDDDGGGGFLPAAAFIANKFATARAGQNPKDDVFLCSDIQSQFNHWAKGDVFAQLRDDGELDLFNYPAGFANQGEAVGSVLPSLRNNVITFSNLTDRTNPDSAKVDWQPNNFYEVRLPKELRDTDEKKLVGCPDCEGDTDNYFYWRFTTGASRDETAPSLSSSFPEAGANNVPRSFVFSLDFSEAISASDIIAQSGNLNTANILLEQIQSQGGSVVSSFADKAGYFDVSLSGQRLLFSLNDKQRAVFDGKPYLEPYTWYRLTLRNLRDLCGNPIAESVIEFQTNSLSPGVAFVRPSDGYSRACMDAPVFIRFNTSMYDVANQTCAVGKSMVRAGQLKKAGDGAGVNLSALPSDNYYLGDHITPRPGSPNDYCRQYDFNLAGVSLEPETQYEASVTYSGEAGSLKREDWSFAVAPPGQCANEPYLSAARPDQGAWGQCLTLRGANLGTSGEMRAKLATDSGRNNSPSALSQSIIDFWRVGEGKDGFVSPQTSWQERQITGSLVNLSATAPADANLRRSENLDLELSARVDYGGDIGVLTSNPLSFYLDSGNVYSGPCLAAVSPDSGAWGDAVALTGERLGDGNNDSVEFTQSQLATEITSWQASRIEVKVPDNSQDGPVQARVDGAVSNPVFFDVTQGDGDSCQPPGDSEVCGPGLVCSDNLICEAPSGFAIASYFPSNQCADNCVNTAIGLRANRDLKTTQGGGVFKILPCQDDLCSQFDADILSGWNLEDSRAVLFNASPLLAGKSYRAVVKGGSGGLLAADDSALSSLNYDKNNDGVRDSFSWLFKIGQNNCSVSRVEVRPRQAILFSGQTLSAHVNAFGDNSSCTSGEQRLNLDSGWSWQSSARSDAGTGEQECFAGAEPLFNFNPAAPTGPSASLTAGTLPVGQARKNAWLCAQNSGNKDFAPLTLTSVCAIDEDCSLSGQCGGSTCLTSGPSAGRCSPVIKSFTPVVAPAGNLLTINGCYFGNDWGEVKIGSTPAARPQNEQCLNTWSDSRVIAEVGPTASSGNISIIRQDGQTADSAALTPPSFTIGGSPVPAICYTRPEAARRGGLVKMFGAGFGSSGDFQSRQNPGTPTSSYAVIVESTENLNSLVVTDQVSSTACALGGWSNTQICLNLPALAPIGQAGLRVRTNNTPSGAFPFRVIDTSQIRPGAVNLQAEAISPPAGQEACLNIVIEVKLNTALDTSTLQGGNPSVSNFIVRSTAGAEVSGTITSRLGGGKTTLRFSPNANLTAATDYQVVLKGGESGLRSSSLGIMEPSSFCPTLSGVDCIIGFRTLGADPAGLCALKSASLEPASPVYFCAGQDNCEGDESATPGHQRNFQVALKNGLGQTINSQAGNWQWSTSDANVLSATSDISGPSALFTVLPKNGSSVITAQEAALGVTAATEARVFLCENPWSGPNPPYYGAPYFEPSTNFSTFYCRDQGAPGTGDDLPALNNPIDSTSRTGVPNLVKELFFIQPYGTKACTAGGNDGTLTNMSESSWVDGKAGRALRFDGNNDYVSVVDADNLDISGAVTVSAWIKLRRYPTPTAPGGNAWQILSKGGTDPSHSLTTLNSMIQWYIGNDTNVGEGLLNFYATIGGVWIGGRSTSKLPLNEWVFVAATYDGAQIVNYLNAVPTAGRAASGLLNTNQFSLKIGTGINNQYFDGDIDEVRVYNRAMSAAEIQQLFAAASEQLSSLFTDGLVGYWPFDEGDGIIVKNQVGSAGKKCQTNSDCAAGQCLGTSDAIGARVIANPEHYPIADWYRLQNFGAQQATNLRVDGYEALRSGRTVYVSAANPASLDSTYTNVYLFSYNEDSSPETEAIFGQMVNNLRFAANVPDAEIRAKIRRDGKRLSDARELGNILQGSAQLPALAAGSYEPGLSLSVWPSWNETLSSALGATLPQDTINQINCLNSPAIDQNTCWDPGPAATFRCQADSPSKKSRFYSYSYDKNTGQAALGFNLEYAPSSWAHAGGDYRLISGDACQNLQLFP